MTGLIEFIKYLFQKRVDPEIPWVTVVICRWRGHPHSVVWFNPNGLDPDMSCSNCGDDLG